MMFLKAIVGVLLMGTIAMAAPANAPSVAIDPASVCLDRDAFQIAFNVVLTDRGWGDHGFPDTGDWVQDNTIGFSIGVCFDGPAEGNITLDKALIQKTANEWAQEIAASPAPKPYLLADFGAAGVDGIAMTTSHIIPTADGLVLTSGLLDERIVYLIPPIPPVILGFQGVEPVTDTVVARFIVWWDRTEITAANWLGIHLQAGGDTPDPFFLTNTEGLGPVLVNVANNGLVVTPEPATMGLLAVGLVGLVARRGRAWRPPSRRRR